MSYIEFFGTLLNLWSVYLVTQNNILNWPIGNVGGRKSKSSNEKMKEIKEEKYTPPPPKIPRRSSESGGYGYTKVSG